MKMDEGSRRGLAAGEQSGASDTDVWRYAGRRQARA